MFWSVALSYIFGWIVRLSLVTQCSSLISSNCQSICVLLAVSFRLLVRNRGTDLIVMIIDDRPRRHRRTPLGSNRPNFQYRPKTLRNDNFPSHPTLHVLPKHRPTPSDLPIHLGPRSRIRSTLLSILQNSHAEGKTAETCYLVHRRLYCAVAYAARYQLEGRRNDYSRRDGLDDYRFLSRAGGDLSPLST